MPLSTFTRVEFSPTTAPLSTPSWVDISEYVRGCRVVRGRAHELDTFSAGRCFLTLDNRDRRFDPNHATGPYFGNLKPRRRIRVTSFYGPVLQSADGTKFVLAADTDGALMTVVATAPDSLTATTTVLADSGAVKWAVTVENDGSLSTATTGSAATAAPILQAPDGGKWLLGVATDGSWTTTSSASAATGAAQYLFTGFVDGWPQEYNPPNDAVVNLSATDGFGILATTTVPSVWEQEVRTLAPLRWYRLGEDTGTVAQDFSSNQIDATYVGGATFNSRGGLVVGDDDRSIFFDKGQSVTLDPAIPAAYPFTIAAVFHSPSVGDTWNARYVYEWADAGGSVRFDARIINSGGIGPGKLACRFFNGGDTRVLTSSGRVDDGRTHLLVVSATSASSIAVYLNNTAMTDITTSGTGAPALGAYISATIGNDPSTVGSELPTLGEVDEFLIFNSALSAAQATTLYNAAFTPWDADSPSTRIGRVFDYLGWPTADRNLDTGSAQLGPFIGGGTALDQLQEVARAEGGRSMLYIAGDGKLTFVGRSDFWAGASYITSVATFGDDAGELDYSADGFAFEYDDSEVRNRARIAAITGEYRQADNSTSQTNYGIRSFEQRILEKRPSYVQDAADYIVTRFGDVATRLEQITVKPERDPAALYPILFAADFGFRYTVKRRPQGVGSAISVEVQLEQVEHNITPTSWTTRWQLSPAENVAWAY